MALPSVGAYAEVQNLSGFKSAMGQVNSSLDSAHAASKRLEGSTGGLSGALSSIANVGFAAVATAAAAAASAIAGVAAASVGFVIEGIKTNANLEQLEIKLDTVTGNGKEMLAWVREISKATPFTSEALGNVISMAAAYGFSAEEAKKLALTAGDASAALGGGADTMNRIIRALGQMKARTKVTASEMLQLTEVGVPAWDVLSKAMGVSVAELQEMVSKGIVPSDEAIKILSKSLDERFGGAMQKQSRTARGLWDTIRETISLTAADISAPLFETIKVLLEEISALLESTDFKGFIEKATEAVGRFAAYIEPILVNFIRNLPEIVSGMADAVRDAIQLFNRISAAIKGIIALVVNGDITGEFYKAFGFSGPLMDGVAVFLKVRDKIISFVNIAIATFERLKVTLWPIIRDIGGFLIKGFLGRIEHIINLITGILTGDWELAWQAFEDIVKDKLGMVLSLVDLIAPGTKDAVNEIISDVFGGIEQAVSGGGIKIGGLDFSSIFESVRQFLTGGGIQGAISGFMGTIQGGLAKVQTFAEPFISFFQRLAAWWAEHGPGITASATTLFNSLVGAISNLASDIIPWLVEQLDVFATWLEENGPLIESFIAKVVEIASAIITEIGKIWPVIQPLLDLIINTLLSTVTLVMQIVTGDWAGAWNTLKQWVIDTVNLVIEFLVNFANWVIGWFGMTGEQFTAIWRNNWDMLKLIVETIIANVRGFIEKTLNDIASFIENILTSVSKTWEDIWNTIWFTARAIWVNIIASVRQAVEDLQRGVKEKLEAVQKFFEDTFNRIKTAIQPVVDAFETFMSTLENIWEWVQSHTLDLQFEFPELPDWITPGSATPFEVGLRGIASALDVLTSTSIPKLNTQLAGLGNFSQPSMVPIIAPAPQVIVRGGDTNNYQSSYSVNANYGRTQSAGRVRDDLETMRLMKRGR